METGRTATDFGGYLIANSKVPVFPLVADIPGYRFWMQSIQCNDRLDVVPVFVFLLGKDCEDHGKTFLCQTEESATL